SWGDHGRVKESKEEAEAASDSVRVSDSLSIQDWHAVHLPSRIWERFRWKPKSTTDSTARSGVRDGREDRCSADPCSRDARDAAFVWVGRVLQRCAQCCDGRFFAAGVLGCADAYGRTNDRWARLPARR